MSITQPAAVPLEHRLREVPQSLRMVVETDTWSSNTPVGHLCHEAAAEIERLRRIEEAAQRIKHWHDHVFPDGSEGMVVSADAVRALWDALAPDRADA